MAAPIIDAVLPGFPGLKLRADGTVIDSRNNVVGEAYFFKRGDFKAERKVHEDKAVEDYEAERKAREEAERKAREEKAVEDYQAEELEGFLNKILQRIYDSGNAFKTLSIDRVRDTITRVINTSMIQRKTTNFNEELEHFLQVHLNDKKKIVLIVAIIIVVYSLGRIEFSNFFLARNVTNPDVAMFLAEIGVPVTKMHKEMQQTLIRNARLAAFVDTFDMD